MRTDFFVTNLYQSESNVSLFRAPLTKLRVDLSSTYLDQFLDSLDLGHSV